MQALYLSYTRTPSAINVSFFGLDFFLSLPDFAVFAFYFVFSAFFLSTSAALFFFLIIDID